jgi:exopolysaccharide production protein ExoQ
MTMSVKLLDRLYVVLVLTLSSTAFVTFFVNGTNMEKLSSPVTTGSWLFVYFVTILRLVKRRHQLKATIHGNMPLLFLVGLCFASSFWSVDGNATRHAATALILTTLIAIDFKQRYPFEEIVRLATYTLIVLIIIGVPLDLFLNGLVPNNDYDPGTWHGVFGTKNDLGRLIVMAAALFFCLPIKHKILKILVIPPLYLLLYKVQSTGALINFSLIVAATVISSAVWFKPKARNLTLVLVIIAAGLGAYLAISHRTTVTTSVGKDPSLTGRTELWRMAIKSIQDRPALGYGYGAFWGQHQQLAYRIREDAHWLTAPHSHNGYLEMALGLGFVGLASLLCVYAQMGRRAYGYLKNNQVSLAKAPLIYLIFFIIYQFTEASLVGGNSIFWIMFTVVSLHLAAEARVPKTVRLTVFPRPRGGFAAHGAAQEGRTA